MKEHPILFSAPMVRALLNGTKTQTREIVSVRVERLQDISDADARAEGIYTSTTSGIAGMDAVMRLDGSEVIAMPGVPRMDYRILWEQINGPDSWDVNPWVWVVEFKRVQP